MNDSDVSDVGIVKRKARAPTTRLTLDMYRKQGYICDVSERWNAFASKKNDLLGFCDIVAVGPHEVLFIQTTSRSNMSSRRKKILENDAARRLMELPSVRVILCGWYKKGSRWHCLEEFFTGEAGYLCNKCALKLGGEWPEGHAATIHPGLCPECSTRQALASVDDYNWPKGSNKPRFGAGRD